jgi:mannose-6-phosphate isomerase
LTAQLLATKRVDKPWGRHDLWPGFANPAPGVDPVGEVWFQTPHPETADLLVKYLFTSEKLSVQVHPNDQQAHAAGLPRGKDECWVILAAQPDSTIALGTKAPTDAGSLRAAALDGSIDALLDWKPVKAGDFIYLPSNTIHAIGAGLTLVEVQQNSDTTYRLYDYGRGRELHLEEGMKVADPNPFTIQPIVGEVAPGRTLLVEGPKFVLERRSGGEHRVTLPAGVSAWAVPLTGSGVIDDVAFMAGECILLSGVAEVEAEAGSDWLLAYPGARRV